MKKNTALLATPWVLFLLFTCFGCSSRPKPARITMQYPEIEARAEDDLIKVKIISPCMHDTNKNVWWYRLETEDGIRFSVEWAIGDQGDEFKMSPEEIEKHSGRKYPVRRKSELVSKEPEIELPKTKDLAIEVGGDGCL